ncbi:MAG: ABC transporter ATP-binding protein [Verrucomicrobiota bacterium]
MHHHTLEGLERPKLKGFLWSQRKKLLPFLTLRSLSIIAITPFPVISQLIVDKSIPNKDIGEVWFFTWLSIVLLLLHLIFMKIAVSFLTKETQDIFRRMRARIFHKLNFMHFGFLDSTQTGRLLSKYAFDTSNIEMTTIQSVAMIIPEIFRSLLLVAALAWINLWLVVIVLICVPIFALVRIIYFEPLEKNNEAVRRAREKMTGQASEFISAIKLVRGYGREDEAREEMNRLSHEYGETRAGQMKINQSLGYMLFSVVTALSLFAVAFCGWLVIEDQMSLGALVALIGALPVCLTPVTLISQFSTQYLLGAESYRSIKELLDSAYVEDWKGTFQPEEMKGTIRFRDVSFTYEKNSEERTIDHFTMLIKAGEHVAFVGPSGSGKSTLVSLILGFYAPTEGDILIDGTSQSDWDIRHLRQNCAIVMQDNLLLSGTLLDNIRFGKPDATMEEVREAAQHAYALEFIDALPDGFNSKVGERGVSLSGGQRQRIAIARALLRDPPILILDEATSALDYESEKAVQNALDYLASGRTTITIAHRLSTIRGADRIIVLRSGKSVAEGTWEELAEEEGPFRDMLRAQS